jgi:LysM repeat protein
MCKEIRIFVFILCSFGAAVLHPVQAQELLDYPLDTIKGEEVYVYQVEKGIGLYRIGVNFNVPQSEIVRLNPQLRERGLKLDETLYLPTGRKVEKGKKTKPEVKVDRPKLKTDTMVQLQTIAQLFNPEHPVLPDTVAPDQPAAAPEVTVETETKPYAGDRRVVELALMLPFESQQNKRSGNAERMMEFYQGALLALHNLQNDSILYRLRVYDTERSELRVTELCDSLHALDHVQGILGLVYPIQIDRVAAWCTRNEVPLLLPFSDNTNLRLHPQVLQFNSTDAQEADSLCAWISRHDSTVHCVAIDVREADLSSSVRTLRKEMKARQISYSTLTLQHIMADSTAYALDSTKENLIILHSDRFQHVRMLLPHLQKMQEQGFRIRIISQYSWQKERIAVPQLYTSMFTAELENEEYDALWEYYFVGGHNSDAPRYDLLGYDLMRALTGWLQGKKAMSGLQSDIQWVQTQNGGYQNACVRVVEK